jgi:hypothetical protein
MKIIIKIIDHLNRKQTCLIILYNLFFVIINLNFIY